MISQNDIQQLIDTIVEKFHPEKVILFGSYARGTQDDESDIDLVVITSDEKTDVREQAAAMGTAVWNIPGPKDILVRTRKQFQEEIAAEWTVFHAAEEEGVVLFERCG